MTPTARENGRRPVSRLAICSVILAAMSWAVFVLPSSAVVGLSAIASGLLAVRKRETPGSLGRAVAFGSVGVSVANLLIGAFWQFHLHQLENPYGLARITLADRNGTVSSTVKTVEGAAVVTKGFMYPTQNMKGLQSFFLIPTRNSNGFVSIAKADRLFVFVTLQDGTTVDWSKGPVVVQGTMRVSFDHPLNEFEECIFLDDAVVRPVTSRLEPRPSITTSCRRLL